MVSHIPHLHQLGRFHVLLFSKSTSFSPHSLEGVQVTRFVEVFFPFFGYSALGLKFSPGLSSLEYPVVLLGVYIERFFLEQLRAGERDSLYGGVSAGAGHHHDDITVVSLHLEIENVRKSTENILRYKKN